MTQQEILNGVVEARMKKQIFKWKTYNQHALYLATGRGVSSQEYLKIVDRLVAEGFCTQVTGDKGGKYLHIVETEQTTQPGA